MRKSVIKEAFWRLHDAAPGFVSPATVAVASQNLPVLANTEIAPPLVET